MKTVFLFILTPFLLNTISFDAIPSGVYRWTDAWQSATDSGSRTTLIEGSTTALERLTLNAVRLSPGASFEEGASHADMEALIIVKEGLLTTTAGESYQTFGPGSVAVILPEETHSISNTGDVPVTFYLFRYQARKPSEKARGNEAGGSILLDWNDVEVHANDKGARRQQFDRATTMFSRFEMHVTTLNEGITSHPPHQHREEEFILVLKGDVEEYIDGKTYQATAGDVIFLDAQSMHNIRNAGNGQAEYFAFKWE